MPKDNVDKDHRPPKWIDWLLERCCDPYLLEGILGDLQEEFQEKVESEGSRKAKWSYTLQALGFLRMVFRKKNKKVSTMKSIWLNYFLASFRTIKKQKTLFSINLIGLIMAISCSLFALIYIHDELQFDTQHRDGSSIYRLYKRYINIPEKVDHLTYETSGMMGPTMVEEYPEVADYVRVLPWWHSVVLSYEKTNITTEQLYFADSNFFRFFDYKVLMGDPQTFLTAPSSIVLTQSLAQKIFGEKNPINEKIIGLNSLDYTVTGVVADPPRQSSLQFEGLVSWSTTVPDVGPLNMPWMNNWLAQGIFTFVKLSTDADPKKLTSKLPDMMNRHLEERADQYFLNLLPLRKMHLYGEDIRGSQRLKSGSITFVYMLGFSAFLIFLIATVNYINIALSRATKTRVEVGVRKVMGSSRSQLMGRFITETFFSTLVASVLSIFLIIWLLPFSNDLSGKELTISMLFQPLSILFIVGFILGTSLIVGTYPALVLSSPPISSILKSSSGTLNSSDFFRKTLLTLQYSISIFLIICTTVIVKQTNYLENKPLGFDKEQVLVLDIDNEVAHKVEVLEAELLKHPNIISVSTTRSTMGSGSFTTTVTPEGYTDELNTRIFGVDQEFFETYGITTLKGRTFEKGTQADSSSFIVNEALVKFMGWEDPIGKHIRTSPEASALPIIGVVQDFHVNSPATTTIEPMILYLNTTTKWYTAARLGNGAIKETIRYINDQWDKLAKRTPFDFYFLDQWFDDQYKKERRLLRIASIYAIISIVLCGLGLYGLTALTLQQRMKEISIRKVLGATVSSIISMMNKQFLIIILISVLIATPVTYYLINDWLAQFAYKTSVTPYPFIFSGGITCFISIVIVSILAAKSAFVNPSENLKTE